MEQTDTEKLLISALVKMFFDEGLTEIEILAKVENILSEFHLPF